MNPEDSFPMSPRLPLQIANAATATFECTFGRGCDGL